MTVDGWIKPFPAKNMVDVVYLVFRLKHSSVSLQLSLQLAVFYFRIQALPLSKLFVSENKVVLLFGTHWGHTGNLSEQLAFMTIKQFTFYTAASLTTVTQNKTSPTSYDIISIAWLAKLKHQIKQNKNSIVYRLWAATSCNYFQYKLICWLFSKLFD